MTKKQCCRCKKRKDILQFSANKSKKSGYNAFCKICWNIYLKAHYAANKSAYIKKARRHDEKMKPILRAIIDKFQGDSGCRLCGEKSACCLDAHHVDSTIKERVIGCMVGHGYSVKTLQEELIKCVCVCRNCHAKIHAGLLSCPPF